MKKKLLQKQRGILVALLCFLCVISINAQTELYSNDFETSDGLVGSTIVGNGAMEPSGDAAHGQVFHNNPANTNAVRTNYLKLPSTIFSDFQATGSQGLTVSFWVNKSNATDFFWSPMFGAYGAAPSPTNGKPAFTLMARSNGLVNFDYTNSVDQQNYGSNNFDSGSSTSWLDDGVWHFYTFTITPTTGIVYVDGVVKNQWTFTSGVGGLFHVASVLQYITLGGNQAWDWGDRDPAFSFDKLKIYAGALSAVQIGSLKTTDGLGTAPELTASTSSIAFEGTTSASFTVTGMHLTDAVTLTAPLGITLSTYSIPTNPTDVSVTVTYDGTTSVADTIRLSSGTTTAKIAVKSYDSNCFTPLYSTGNLITDSRCNSYLTDGWGGRSINTNPTYVYCGSSSGHMNGGAYQRNLNGTNGNAQMLPNTTYRVKAQLYGISGDNGIGVFGWSNGQGDIHHNVTNGSWQTVDFTFTSGATLGGSQGIYFGFGEGYIDNWEMYLIPPVINVIESSIAAMATIVGSTDSKTITVSANGLSGAITLALSGTDADQFSVSSASLPLTADSVASTVVTITYTPTAVSLSHVATLTISSTGATDKVFALTGSSSSTSIEKIANTSWNALVVNGKLKVVGVDSFEVYSVQGLKIAQVTANSSSKTVALNQGVYVVKTDKGVQKVIVK